MLNRSRSMPLAEAIRFACETEIRALKPGNVGLHGDGHGMSTADFIASAEAIAGPLTQCGLTVGERILAAVEATRQVVPCNTNLGIVLLCAPLAHAALRVPTEGSLRHELEWVLAALDVADAEHAYRAIRLANPGGLGDAPHHDVAEAPQVHLLAAMREAWQRDSIARQYATGYWDVFELGVPGLHRHLNGWGSMEWAATAVYLEFLARLPDSHIQRKHGESAAQAVSREARAHSATLRAQARPEQAAAGLLEWDARLKRRGINPGTSADLTVATLLVAHIEKLLEEEFTAIEPVPGLAGNQTWDHAHNFVKQPM